MTLVFEPPVSPPLPPPLEDGSELWELLYESLSPLNEPDPEEALKKFCIALCAPLQPAYDLVRARSDTASWGIVFDANLCPVAALPYLAQFVGVQLTPEMSVEQMRNEIRQPTGWKRGQPESIQIAVRRTLTGENPLVIIHPRTPEVGHHYIRTLLSQTPEPSRTEAIIRAVLPAWEVLDYAAIIGVTVADISASTKWTTVADLATKFASVQKLTEVLPSEL